MKIAKTFNITLTPDEVAKIIKDHIKKEQKLDVDNLEFRISTKHEGIHDQYGTDYLSKIICTGKLEE
jgi:hypothetical protein